MDRWLNKILLGDCLDVMRELPDNSIDAIITDPPYSSGGQFKGDRSQTTSTKYVNSDSSKTCRVEFEGDNRDQRSFLLWCSLWMSEARRLTRPGGIIVCFTDWRQLPTITDAIQCGGWVWRGIGTWWKPGIRMQHGRLSSSAEYIVYGSNGPVTPGKASPQNVFSCKPVGGVEKEHIAEKPIEVLKWVLNLVPDRGLILDPFMGSGTTGCACVQSKHSYIGIELNPEYVHIANERIKQATRQERLFL